ncbi:MAG TPA: hypothetical protein VKB52_06355 [Rhodanobacteraceae bacterium]|nr:hypothetical protein [Rhodanobacteraceae bacterium]
MRELSPARLEPLHGARLGHADYHGWYVAGFAFSLLMLALHVAGGLHTAGVPDFWRDVWWAAKIAHGEAFPLAGPPIYGLVELGPWWYYVLALPVGLFGCASAAAVFVQLVAGAKYLVAWQLGTRAIDARFGLAFAGALAIAGWSTIPLMFPSHTAVVETMLLLLAGSAWRCWRRFSVSNALVFGLAAGACLTAHPTTVSYVAGAGFVLLWREPSWTSAGRLALAALVVVAMMAPPWFDPAPAVATRVVGAYVGADVGVDIGQRAPALLASALVGGAWNAFLLMTDWTSTSVRVAWLAYCACLLVAAAGLLALPRERTGVRALAVAGGVAFLLQATFLVVLRPTTPMWMLSSLLPPLALLVGAGWYGAFASDRVAVGSIARIAFGACVALSLAPFGLFLRNLHTMRVALGANPYANAIDAGEGFGETNVPYFPVRRIDRLAPSFCEPAVLHARLAWVVEQSLETPLRLACGEWPALRFGGVEGPARHVAGLLPRASAASGIAPDRIVAGMALYERVTPVAPASGGRPTILKRGQIHADRAPDTAAAFAPEFDAQGADVAVLTNRFPGAMPLAVTSASANGKPAKLLDDDGGSKLYRCADCDAATTVHWRFELQGVADDIDLAVLRGAAD